MSSTPTSFATTPEPPYFAVIFSSQRSAGDRGYDQMAQRMASLAAQQPGFLGIETVRGADGFGITVSYWSTAEAKPPRNRVVPSGIRIIRSASARCSALMSKLKYNAA